MGDVIGFPIPLDDELRHELVTELARYSVQLTTQQAIKKKFRFDDATWERLGEDETIIAAVDKEVARRIRSGATARERAQVLYADVPRFSARF
jgi:hypothetical protein